MVRQLRYTLNWRLNFEVIAVLTNATTNPLYYTELLNWILFGVYSRLADVITILSSMWICTEPASTKGILSIINSFKSGRLTGWLVATATQLEFLGLRVFSGNDKRNYYYYVKKDVSLLSATIDNIEKIPETYLQLQEHQYRAYLQR